MVRLLATVLIAGVRVHGVVTPIARATIAADIVAGMCRRLVDAGVPELHFYTLNLAKPTEAVIARLG